MNKIKKWSVLLFFYLLPFSGHAHDIQQIIQKIKFEQYSATDLSKWTQLQKSTTLCLQLSLLDENNLIYFETVLPDLNCGVEIENKLLKFQQELKNQFIQSYREKNPRLLSLKPAPPIQDNPHLGLIDTETGPVLVKADLPAGVVALTFDDGPHPTLTPKLFEHLERSSVGAVFFPTGVNANRYPQLIQEYLRLGHTYGSHTMTHPDLRRVSYSSAKNEIIDALDLLTDLTGEEIRFFRFPYGATNPELNQFVKTQRIASFFWNIDSEDWRHRDPLKAYNQVIKQLNERKSGIILFHDIVSATEATVKILLSELDNKGYKIVLLRPKKH